MPTEVLSCGPAVSILQNVVYAMPACIVRVHSLAAVEISVDGIAWDPIASAVEGIEVASVFLRCTTGNTTVVLKKK